MAEPTIESQLSAQSSSNRPLWLIAGHISSNPDSLTSIFQGNFKSVEINENSSEFTSIFNDVDACAMVINAKTGVSSAMIEFWNYVSERQFPRVVIVTGLELSETDFDDMVLIANRVLEEVVTPYLVLHDDLGEPIGLIGLAESMVHDYSQKERRDYPADDELKNLIAEFRSEYLEQMDAQDPESFRSGLLVPAIPLVQSRSIGVAEIQAFLDQATKL